MNGVKRKSYLHISKHLKGMLFPILFLYVTSYVSAKICDKNQFWSTYLEKCEHCSRCYHPDITIRPCQRHKDTVCGPLSEINADWSFLRHPYKGAKSSNPQKEMLQTFKENFEEIRQHEKHVREKQKYMHDKHKTIKDSSEDYNEIVGGDILIGNKRKNQNGHNKSLLLENLKEWGRSSSRIDSEKKQKDREKRMRLLQTLFYSPIVLGSLSDKMHFDDDEAFELLRGGRKKNNSDDDDDDDDDKSNYNPNDLKFDKDGVLLKDFGFSHLDPETVKMEKLVGEVKIEQKSSSNERVSTDWRLAIAAGLLITHTIIILIIAAYCIRKNGKKIKDYLVTDIAEVQTWILPKDKENKYPSSGVYKPTTEVRTGVSGSKCKYLERIINKNGKKKVNFYVGVKLPPEMKPLTGKYPSIHMPVGDRV